MNTSDSQQIIQRFFDALYYLKANKEIRGKATFTREYGIDRWNLLKLEKDMSRGIFQPAWLTYLVKDFGISSQWLLTGAGPIKKATKKKW